MIEIDIDGACSKEDMGIGVVIKGVNLDPIIISEYFGKGTNNIAEYGALLRALDWLVRDFTGSGKVIIRCDSKLVVEQVNLRWACKQEHLLKYQHTALMQIQWLKDRGIDVELKYVPREVHDADAPAKDGYINYRKLLKGK